MKNTLQFHRRVLGCVVVALMGASGARANLMLGFDYGGSSATPVTNQVDAFTGKAGDGWVSTWSMREQTAANSNFSASVINTNPFSSGSGNYLQMQYESLSASNARAGVSRQFSTDPMNGGINAAQPFSMNFDLRFDAFSGTMGASSDQFLITTSVSNAVSGFALTSPIRIWYLGGTGWAVYNGATIAYMPGLTSIAAGEVFNFQIDVNPLNSTWDISIGYDGATYSMTNLGIYPDTDISAANHLVFRGMRTTGSTMDWSLDNVQVVPEPSAAALCLGGLALVGWLRRRKV